MIRSVCSLRALCALALVAAIAAASVPASAQIGTAARTPEFQPRIGVGYVANIPNQFAGVSAHWLSGAFGGIGVYVDVKFDLENPENIAWYIDSLTVAEVEETIGHQVFSRAGNWTTVNVALMRPLTPQFVIYAGVGYSEGKEYREYFDPLAEMHETGFYWVRDEEMPGSRLNLLGGAMLQISRMFTLQFGMESAPGGFTVGASYLIPLR